MARAPQVLRLLYDSLDDHVEFHVVHNFALEYCDQMNVPWMRAKVDKIFIIHHIGAQTGYQNPDPVKETYNMFANSLLTNHNITKLDQFREALDSADWGEQGLTQQG
jgi:hypothetical protein